MLELTPIYFRDKAIEKHILSSCPKQAAEAAVSPPESQNTVMVSFTGQQHGGPRHVARWGCEKNLVCANSQHETQSFD